jgi:hypothetical protein
MKNPKNKQTYARTRICIYVYDNDKFTAVKLLLRFLSFEIFVKKCQKLKIVVKKMSKITSHLKFKFIFSKIKIY